MRLRVVGAYMVAMFSLAGVGLSAESMAGSDFQIGNNWIYDASMTMYDSVVISGTLTESFNGESTKSVAGFTYNTYEMKYQGSLTVTGTLSGYAVVGTSTMTGTDSIDQESMDVISSDQTMSMTLSYNMGFPATYEYWEHNVSTYSPPGGVGDEPNNPGEGTSWIKTYTVHSESSVIDDGDVTDESSSFTQSMTFTYKGIEEITVPAGTFKCEVYQIDDGDSISTEWWSDDVGSYVKRVYDSGSSGSATELLQSYSYTPPSPGLMSSAMIYMIIGVAVAVVIVVVLLLLKRRSRPPVPQPVVQTLPVTIDPGPPRPPPAG